MHITLFCSSSNQLAQHHLDNARALGEFIGEHNDNLLYGGANKGLMEVVAKSCKNFNGYTGKIIGVIPRFLRERGLVSTLLDVQMNVDDMMHRKKMLLDKGDVFVVLPGGYGTLDEMFEVLAYQQVSGISKPVLLLDPHGFYIDLLAQIERMISDQMMNRNGKGFHIIEKPEEIMAYI